MNLTRSHCFRTVSCRSVGRSLLLTLTKESLAKAVQPYPQIARSIRQMAEERFSAHVKTLKTSAHVDFGEELDLQVTHRDLQTVPLFKNCEVGFLHNLALTLQPVCFTTGDLVFRRDDVATEMYFVARGVAEAFDESSGHIFAQFQPGTFFGEVGILFQTKRSASVRPLSDELILFKLRRADLDKMMIDYPEVKSKIEEEAQNRLDFIKKREGLLPGKNLGGATEIEVIREKLKMITFFKDASISFLHQLAATASIKSATKGSCIIKKDEAATSMFFIIDGLAAVVSEDMKTTYAELANNAFFGEVGLLFEITRTATVIAKSSATLLEISKDAFRNVLVQHPTLKSQLFSAAEENYKLFISRQSEQLANVAKIGLFHHEAFDVEVVYEKLKALSIFKNTNPEFIRMLSLRISTQSMKQNDWILRKGEQSREIYIIVKGSVEIVSDDGKVVFDSLADGDFFGEVGVMRNIKRTASVRVSSQVCDLFVLSAVALRHALAEYPENFAGLMVEAENRFELAEKRELLGEHALTRTSVLSVDTKDVSSTSKEADSAIVLSPISPTKSPAENVEAAKEEQKTKKSSFGMLFGKKFTKQSKSTADSKSHLKNESKWSSKDTLPDEEPKKGMSINFSSLRRRISGSATHMPKPDKKMVETTSDNNISEKSIGVPIEQAAKLSMSPKSNLKSTETISGSTSATASFVESNNEQDTQQNGKVDQALNKMRKTIEKSVSMKAEPITLKNNVDLSAYQSIPRKKKTKKKSKIRNILDLDEVELSIVFSQIPPLQLLALRGVCLKWSEVLLGSIFWANLDLQRYASSVNRYMLESFADICAHNLRYINLTNCWMIFDDNLITLTQVCPYIKGLSISNCWKITDYGLAYVANNSPKMLELDISYCGQITGAGLKEHKLFLLKKLDISYCKQITDDTLEKALSKMSELRVIHLRRCSRITDFGIFIIVRFCRSVSLCCISIE